MNTSTATNLENRLRGSAAGSYPDEAAVELLIRSRWTRRASFITHCTHPIESDDGSWIDWQTIAQILAGEGEGSILAASSGELRVLRIAHSLAHGLLADAVPGLDRQHLDHVLAAIAHAAGSHHHQEPPAPEPNGWCTDSETGQRMSLPSLGSLHPWPATKTGTS